MFFDIKSMVDDLGGATKISTKLECCRTTPYGWIKRGSISSKDLVKLKQAFQGVSFDMYFRGDNEYEGYEE